MSKHEDKEEATPEDDPVEPAKESKVISKGKASLIISGAEAARSEARKPQPLAPEPRIAVAKVEEPKEQHDKPEPEDKVQRLESQVNPGKERIKVDKAKFEKREQRPDEAEIQENHWGRGISPGWWVTIAGASAAALLLGGLAIKSWFDGDQALAVVTPSVYVSEPDPFEGSPERWFRERAGKIGVEATSLLKAYMGAKDDVSRSQWVRFPDLYLKRAPLEEKKIQPRLDQINDQSYDIDHTGETAFVTLDCKDADFMPFRAYFTKQGDSLRLDWTATVAWSEVSFSKIKSDIKTRQDRIEKLQRDDALAKKTYATALKERAKALEAKRQQDIRRKKASEPPVHTVAQGENISTIAKRYKITTEQLMTTNQLKNDLLQIGQKLQISTSAPPILEADIVVPPMPTPVAEPVLPAEVYTEPVLVRCLIRRRDEFYAGPYNDKDHSAFMITSPDKLHYMWAYTKRDSQLDLELRRLLDHGRFVVDLKKDIRVTLRIRRAEKDALPSQLELVELVHPEWVTP